jgi:hypothetical protein
VSKTLSDMMDEIREAAKKDGMPDQHVGLMLIGFMGGFNMMVREIEATLENNPDQHSGVFAMLGDWTKEMQKLSAEVKKEQKRQKRNRG